MASECDSIRYGGGTAATEEMIKGILPTPVKVLGRLSGACREWESLIRTQSEKLGLPAHETNRPSSGKAKTSRSLPGLRTQRCLYCVNEVLADYSVTKSSAYRLLYSVHCPFRTISSCTI